MNKMSVVLCVATVMMVATPVTYANENASDFGFGVELPYLVGGNKTEGGTYFSYGQKFNPHGKGPGWQVDLFLGDTSLASVGSTPSDLYLQTIGFYMTQNIIGNGLGLQFKAGLVYGKNATQTIPVNSGWGYGYGVSLIANASFANLRLLDFKVQYINGHIFRSYGLSAFIFVG